MPKSIGDIMTRVVSTVGLETTVKDAAQFMKSKDVGSLPVCTGRRVVGIVTDRDITIRAVAEGRDPGSTRVGEIMSKNIISVRDDSELAVAEELMHNHQLRRLPVLNPQGELVGYLAMAQVARAEDPAGAGKVIKGVSESKKPAPMSARGS